MADERTNPSWEGKTDFPPGWPVDPSALPELLYQALGGRVFTLLRFPDESVSRGEVALADLESVVGGPVTREGWYSASGTYLGAQLPGSLLDE